MRKVQAGQALRIPARDYNGFVDAAQGFQQQQHSRSRDSDQDGRQTGIILVKNTTEAVVARFEALGLQEPLILPGANERAFQGRVAMKGVAPATAYLGRFAILLEPLRPGAISKAVVAGVTVCKVEFPEADEEFELRFAELNIEGDAPLIAQGHGPVQIIATSPLPPEQLDGGDASSSFSETIDGGDASTTEWDEELDADAVGRVRWCVVRLGNSTIGERFTVRAEIDGGSNGTDESTATWTWTVTTLEGATIADEVPAVRYRPNTIYVEPTEPVFGEAFYDEEGDLVLYELDIWEDEEDC